jgi:hypothetical protein
MRAIEEFRAQEELKSAREELLLMMATLDSAAATRASSVLARVERALDILRAASPSP